MYKGGVLVDRELIKQLRKALFLESVFTGVSTLSKMLDQTENELEDVIEYIEKKVRKQKVPDIKFNKSNRYLK